MGKPEGNRALGRRVRRPEDNVKMGLRETEWGDVDCIDVDEERKR